MKLESVSFSKLAEVVALLRVESLISFSCSSSPLALETSQDCLVVTSANPHRIITYKMRLLITLLFCIAEAFSFGLVPLKKLMPPSSTSLFVASQFTGNTININEGAPREVGTFEEWATACGVQKSDGFQLTYTANIDENSNLHGDISVMTNQDLGEGSPVLYVPGEMIMSSRRSMEEFGTIKEAEQRLVSAKASDHVPQFYLFLKILREFELGEQSPWYPWLNSLPRYYSNGASMTPFCFECLPPLAGNLAQAERVRYIQFFQALKYVPFLSEQTKKSKELTKWAFAVVYTRGFPPGMDGNLNDNDFRLVPMADMFNHGSDATEAQISYDDNENLYVYASTNVPAGSPLRLLYGDPTNPSHLLARYGFLDKSSPATFCKIMIPRPSKELKDLGYDHSRMLFYKDSGAVSQEVWDVLLFQILESKVSYDLAQQFYRAHMAGDLNTKQAIQEEYFINTLTALINHVDGFLQDLDGLSYKTEGRSIQEHPRLPLIMGHNAFVQETFLAVRQQLYQLYEQNS